MVGSFVDILREVVDDDDNELPNPPPLGILLLPTKKDPARILVVDLVVEKFLSAAFVDDDVLIDRSPRTTMGAVDDDLLSAARKIEILAVRLFIPLSTGCSSGCMCEID